jgi:hypothetical protein
MILTIGPGGCGFTFLNWSIAYLRGDTYYNTLQGDKVQVDIHPIKGLTAHNFTKDHLNPTDSRVLLSKTVDQSIVYIVPGDNDDFKSLLEFVGKKIIFDNSKFCQEQLARHYVSVPHSPFKYITEQLSKEYDKTEVKKVLLDLSNYFFLNYYKLPNNVDDFFILDYYDIFDKLNDKIIEIFNFLNLTINQERYQLWIDVYKDYKTLNKDILATFIDNTSITTSTKILKEIIQWKNGSYRRT